MPTFRPSLTMSALSSDFCAHDGVDSEELFGYALVEQTHHRRQRFACNLSGGTRSDPTISPIARSTMITTSNSLDRERDAQSSARRFTSHTALIPSPHPPPPHQTLVL